MEKKRLVLVFSVSIAVLLIPFLFSISGLARDNKRGAKGIAFVAFRKKDKKGEIWLMNGNGTNPRRLTDNTRDDDRPTWSPDGKKIAFISDTDKQRYLYVMDADGRNQRRLAPMVLLDPPTWSPDGKKIAFTAVSSQKPHPKYQKIISRKLDIYMIDIDSMNLKKLTEHEEANKCPSWSPDGKKIAFLSLRNAKRTDKTAFFDIYVMNVDLDESGQVNKNLKRLTVKLGVGSSPAWSPDGKKIAFTASPPPKGDNIYVMDADGKNLKNLTNNRKVNGLDPVWSPDGKMIAFQTGFAPVDTYLKGGIHICVINADGTNLRNLTSKIYGMTPTWSPDSKWIAFYSGIWNIGQGKRIRGEICRIAPNGKGLKKLIKFTKEYLYTYPTWSPVK